MLEQWECRLKGVVPVRRLQSRIHFLLGDCAVVLQRIGLRIFVLWRDGLLCATAEVLRLGGGCGVGG